MDATERRNDMGVYLTPCLVTLWILSILRENCMTISDLIVLPSAVSDAATNARNARTGY